MSNKYVYGVQDVHLATYEETPEGPIYDTPVAYPGATEIGMEARGEIVEEYADNTLYVSEAVNNGYDVTLSMKTLTEYFETEILGKRRDANGVMMETNNDKGKPFALMFQFQGDKHNIRHVLYGCTASRPSITSSTRESTFESQTQEITIVASGVNMRIPNLDGLLIRATSFGLDAEVYGSWFNEVYIPTVDALPAPEARVASVDIEKK